MKWRNVFLYLEAAAIAALLLASVLTPFCH
jgi:hypothetical protein